MDRAIRDFFRAERRRLKKNQTVVARAAGVEQGTISKIESDPDYEPSLTVFRKAVGGLGMNLATFFAHIERDATQGLTTVPPVKHTPPSSFLAESSYGEPGGLQASDGFDLLELERIGRSIVRAVDAVKSRQQIAGARPPRATGRAPRRKNR